MYPIADGTEEHTDVAADARRDSEKALNFAARSRLESEEDGASSSTSALRLEAWSSDCASRTPFPESSV